MYEKLTGKGLFVFSDPAGAKACLALNEILKAENIVGERKLFSNKFYSFYQQFNSIVEILDNENLEHINETFDWIFAGTSHPTSSNEFELKILKQNTAKVSYSFIDHWTNFKLRFILGTTIILPTTIIVVDEKAKQLAIEDGLPEERLAIFENPYLSYLKNYEKPSVSKKQFYKHFEIPIQNKIVLYAPDPISLRSDKDGNEISVLKELIEICKSDISLLVKLHPLQPMEAISKIINANEQIILINDTNFKPIDIFKNVDTIVGFYSNYLLEASVSNNNIIRYLFDVDTKDYLADSLAHCSIVVTNKKDLNFAINKTSA
jgi:hypothetical protein